MVSRTVAPDVQEGGFVSNSTPRGPERGRDVPLDADGQAAWKDGAVPWRTVRRRYRRRPARWWWVALLVVPLLLTGVGLLVGEPVQEDTAAPPAATTSDPPATTSDPPAATTSAAPAATTSAPPVVVLPPSHAGTDIGSTSPGGGESTEAVTTCATVAEDVARIVDSTRITFVHGGARLSEDSAVAVAEIAERLVGCPDATVTVAGHTDSVGDADANLALSVQRARTVEEALVDGGVPEDRVEAVGLGEAEPVASNSTAAGRAANRRVEITVATGE